MKPPCTAAPGRRRFVRAAFVSLAGAALSACDRWSDSDAFTSVLRSAQYLSRRSQRAFAGQSMAQEFTEADITQPFRSNGTDLPASALYRRLAEGGFADWALEVGGLVQVPLRLTLAQLKAMPARTQITRHDCVEGWSAIAKWTGVPLQQVLARAGPLPAARYVVFHCADPMDGSDETAPGSTYYESIDLDEACHPQTILAWAVNDQPLPVMNGAPLRLRVERQLGYKHAKYLMKVVLVSRLDNIRGGKGGYWEDLGYEWYAGI